jgi:hypothetical protein
MKKQIRCFCLLAQALVCSGLLAAQSSAQPTPGKRGGSAGRVDESALYREINAKLTAELRLSATAAAKQPKS